MKKLFNLPTTISFAFVLLASLGNLQRIVVNNGIAFYLHETIMALGISYFIFQKPLKYWRSKLDSQIAKLLSNKVFLFFLIWIGVGLASSAIGQRSSVFIALLYILRIAFYALFFYLLSQTKVKLKYLFFNSLFLLTWLWLVYGLLQYFLLPDLKFLAILGWDDHYFRLAGTLLDPNFTGLLLVTSYWSSTLATNIFRRTKFSSLAIKATQALCTFAIALTFSRSTYLSFGITLLIGFFLFDKKIKANLILAAVVLIATILLIPKHPGEGQKLLRTSSISARIESSKKPLRNLNAKTLITGNGLFTPVNSNIEYRFSIFGENLESSIEYHSVHLPSSYASILHGTGIVGLIIFLILTVKYLIKAFRLDKAFGLAVLAVLIHSLFNQSLTYPFVMIAIWLFYFGILEAKTNTEL